MNILSSFKKIRAFVFDVDGVLTDGTLLVLDDGQMARKMNIKDGYALQLAIKKNYHVLVVSGGMSDAVRLRLGKLGIKEVHMNILNKEKIIREFMETHSLSKEQVLYMGDDIPDLSPMKFVGLATCPVDAVPEIRSIAAYISPVGGGLGCARDVIEKVLKLNDDWNDDGTVVSR